jgi:methylmalonyl-CoA mutase N-terminal domain/subunit
MHQRLNDSKTDDDFFTKLCKMKSVKELWEKLIWRDNTCHQLQY